GQPLDGGDHGLGQEEGQQHGDHQSKGQRLQDQLEELGVQVLDRGAVIQDIDDVPVLPPLDGHRHIHIVGGHILHVPLPVLDGGGDVGGNAQVGALLLVGGRQALAGGAVQNEVVAVAVVDAQGADIALEHVLNHVHIA